MKKHFWLSLGLSLSFVFPTIASAEVIYNSIPDIQPESSPSLGFQATQTAEFGDYIQFDGVGRTLIAVDVMLNSWSCQEGNWFNHDCSNPNSESTGYDHPITLAIYNVDSDGVVGGEITNVTQSIHVPWRPASDPLCPNGGYSSTTCNNGYNFIASFSIPNVIVPDSIAYGVSFNTQTWGAEPIGFSGPFNSLNMSVPNVFPSVGIDTDADAVLWNTHTVAYYSTSCPGDTFCRDIEWTGFVPSAKFVVEDPSVGPPTDKNSCKNNGWEIFNNPAFKNQGQCVSYVQANDHAGKK